MPGTQNMYPSLHSRGNRTVNYLRRCVEEKLVVGSIVLRGPPGCGKSALVKVGIYLSANGTTTQAPEAIHVDTL